MNEVIEQVRDRKEIAALVRFERKAEQDARLTKTMGRYVAQDVDYAIITPAYSKDEHWKTVESFLTDNDQKVSMGKLPQGQATHYRRLYEAWKSGQELPVEGTPIRGWSVLSPAQQDNLIRQNIPTVEYLAGINDEGMKSVGMGALDMKRKALAWLAQATDKGPLTMEIADVRRENDLLKANLETLTRQMQQVLAHQSAPLPPPPPESGITAAEILDAPEPVTRSARRAERTTK